MKAAWAFIFNWGIIAAAIILSSLSDFEPFFIPLAWVVIASRQHGFMILMHEGAHQRIASRPFMNDLVSDLFGAYPIFMKTAVYRQNHLAHHLYVNTDRDPDWVRKAGAWDWKYPMNKKQGWTLFFRYIKGLGVYEMLRMWTHLSGLNRSWTNRSSPERKEFVLQVVYYLVAAVAVWQLNLVRPFFIYWILPQVTVLPLLLRLRSVAEHFGLSYQNDLNETRNIICSPLEAFFIAPFNVSYHLNHHLYPTVPFYNLKKLQQVLVKSEEFRAQAHTNTSYLGRDKGALVKDLIV